MTMLHITEERLLELLDLSADELFDAIDEIKADPIQKNWVYDGQTFAARFVTPKEFEAAILARAAELKGENT